MKLYLGGCYQGQNEIALKENHFSLENAYIAGEDEIMLEEVCKYPVLLDLHLLIRRLLEQQTDVRAFMEGYLDIQCEAVITCDKVGNGVIPMEADQRIWREEVGRICCMLTEKSDTVTEVLCGIGKTIKSNQDLTIYFIRHGKTEGNERGCYVGREDQPLTVYGMEEIENRIKGGEYPASKVVADVIYSSPLSRCIQTAKHIYPEKKLHVMEGFMELDFGELEGKNYQDLQEHDGYQNWLASGGKLPFPSAEPVEAFEQRCTEAFLETLECIRESGEKSAVYAVHGGTIMALLHRFAGIPYYELQAKNGQCICCRWHNGRLTVVK